MNAEEFKNIQAQLEIKGKKIKNAVLAMLLGRTERYIGYFRTGGRSIPASVAYLLQNLLWLSQEHPAAWKALGERAARDVQKTKTLTD